ncbi:hypothetical protein [Albirhodobacter sp. R86504]
MGSLRLVLLKTVVTSGSAEGRHDTGPQRIRSDTMAAGDHATQ